MTIIVPYFNFCRYPVRAKNYRTFIALAAVCPGVRFVTVECAFGDAPFEVTKSNNPNHIQVRAAHPLWVKENLINLGIATTTDDLVGWMDADLLFDNLLWYRDAELQLRHFHAIQPFATFRYSRADGSTICTIPSYASTDPRNVSMPGGAWLMRRDAYDVVGGLLECHIMGGGDHAFATAFYGECPAHGIQGTTVSDWVQRVKKLLNDPFVPRRWGNPPISYVTGCVEHLYHGPLELRQYGARDVLLASLHFDPTKHLTKNADGVIQLVNRPDLQAAVSAYFVARKENE